MDAEEKNWNGTWNMWWINIDMENENLSAKSILCSFSRGHNDQTSRIVDEDLISGELHWLLATTYITGLYITHSVYYRRIMIKQIFTNMHSVCFSIFDTLVQPSVQYLVKDCQVIHQQGSRLHCEGWAVLTQSIHCDATLPEWGRPFPLSLSKTAFD